MSVLKIHNLSKYFGGLKAVDGVSFGVAKGEVVGLVGPNGSGKTTLTNLISGLLTATHGHLEIEGTPHTNIRPWSIRRLGISRTFQEVRLFGQMTVLDNVLLALTGRHPIVSIFAKPTSEEILKAEQLLKEFGLYEKRQVLASGLSYGQRKLLEIARVIATDSEILLFDEPYAGLFPQMVELVNKTIANLKATHKSIILIEHNMDIIRKLCDRVIVMDAGKILAHGKPNEVLADKKVIEAYLGV